MKKRSGKHIILAGGGIGVPPMVELAKRLRAEDNLSEYGLIAVIGFKDEPFLEEELKKYCDEVHVTTDNGAYGFHGNILDCIKELKLAFDYGFACGPKVMLKALAAYCNGQDVEGGIPLQVSMEERMGCGYGACVGCICKISKSESHAASTGEGIVELKKVCKDGPVFFGSEVVFDE